MLKAADVLEAPSLVADDTVDETCRRRFESAWRSGCGRIEDHAPAADQACYLPTLEELVHIDLEFQWKTWTRRRGANESPLPTPPLVESYLDRFPRLKQPAIVERLVEQEFLVRQRHDTSPALNEYRERFPETDLSVLQVPSSAPPATAPLELTQLGHYRIVRTLGSGGMGIVYEAEDTQLKRRVALKVMRPEVAAHPEARQRFLREAQAAAALNHDYIAAIHQVGDDRGRLFLAMPLLEGESLEDRLRREGRLPSADVVRIGRETAEGLAAAHARGLIHRDIKPANLWLETRGASDRVKILDFGLARAGTDETVSDRHDAQRASDSATATQTGSVLGTPAYMAPEQARGETVDVRADLYGLGAVLYRMATGRQPFAGTDVTTVLTALQRDTPPAPRTLNPAIPAALSGLIMRMLAKDPAERPVSAAVVVSMLQPAVTRRRLPRSWMAAGALVLGAATLAAFVLIERRRTPEEEQVDGPVAWVEFVPAGAYDAGLNPMALTTGDLNGDGKLDLVVANYGPRAPGPFSQGTISVFLGNGDGNFGPATAYVAGIAPNNLAIADLNGDGRADIIVGNSQGHDVSVFLGQGDGALAPQARYRACRHPCSIAVADFNGDGKLDLAVADQFRNGGVGVLLGHGDGTFAAPVFYATGSVSGPVASYDFNGDGRADLVVSNFLSGTFSILVAKEGGAFHTPANHRMAEPRLCGVADLDGDGKADLLMHSHATSKLHFLHGKGDGTFRDGPIFALPSDFLFVASGDLNNDGKSDVLTVRTLGGQGTLQSLLGCGKGRFVPAAAQPLTIAPAGLALGDFNGDSRPDCAVVDPSTAKAWVYLNRPAAQQLVVANVKALAGRPTYITVIAQDAAGNTATGYAGTIRLTCAGELSGLPDRYVFDARDKGTRAFDQLVFPKPGRYTVTVVDDADPALTASGTVTVAAVPQ